MSTIVRFEKVSELRRSGGPRPRRALTPIWPAERQPTWVAPKKDPLGRARPEGWDVFSRDGLWHYERYEARRRTRWRIVFQPTGQVVEEKANLADCRAETSAGLQNKFATDAFALALRSRLDDPDRPRGHRQLAVHLRVAGKLAGQEADHRCSCGGFLAVVTSGGDLAHVDACDRCYAYGRGLPSAACARAGEHRFCGDPLTVGTYSGCGLWREMCCPGNCLPTGESPAYETG